MRIVETIIYNDLHSTLIKYKAFVVYPESAPQDIYIPL